MRYGKAALTILAVFLLAMAFAADTSDAETSESKNVTWYAPDDLEVHANETVEFTVQIYNVKTDTLHVSLSANKLKETSVSFSQTDIELKPAGSDGDRIDVKAKASANKYASNLSDSLTLTLTIYDMNGGTEESTSKTVAVKQYSHYLSDSNIGKIMGEFDNPFEDTPYPLVAAACITLALWVAIGALASWLVRVVCEVFTQWAANQNSKKKIVDMRSFRKTWKYVFMIVMMYGIENTMIVVGIDDVIVGSIKDVTDILTIIFLGMTVWHIFTTVSNVISDRMSQDEVESSFRPLVLLIGRIIIVVAVFIAILGVSGINAGSLAIAVTLGVTGLSFGAKTVITQFFCGMQIMILRTFRAHDKIRIGTDTTTLVVQEVGIMTTRCKNWSNEELFYVPNSVMSDSKIVNITKDNVYYKVYDYFTIDHKANISRAREVMVEVAYQDPGVVADGSFSKPEVRFSGYDYNEISLRLAYTVIDHDDYGVISARIREKIIARFEEEGIEIPYPQYTVNLIEPEKKGKGAPE
ncbi:MAG: mechanosensitive ion channel family protein [Candidatus Methanomethylophilaceae archaeon]|nr:mechanosensitive ion channel family protein [Candidatus Methanomethylophilaceae archaeon]